MRNKIGTCALLTAMLAAVAVIAISGQAALADEGGIGITTVRLEVPKGSTPISRIVVDGFRKPITNYTVWTETIGDKQYSVLTAHADVVDYCEQYASPAPTYSWSNHTMHWGTQIICNGITHLRIRMTLLSGPDMADFQHSTKWHYGIGASHSDGRVKSCLDWSNFTNWQLYAYAEVDWDITNTWIPFFPYPAGIPPRWQECLDIES